MVISPRMGFISPPPGQLLTEGEHSVISVHRYETVRHDGLGDITHTQPRVAPKKRSVACVELVEGPAGIRDKDVAVYDSGGGRVRGI